MRFRLIRFVSILILFVLGPYQVRASTICAQPGKNGAGVGLSGVLNSYFQGTLNVAAGAGSINLSKGYGANSDITPGDMLLVIQMQNATIDSSNTDTYGDGVPGDPGWGATGYGSTGLYEYVVATNTVSYASGGTVTIAGEGAGGGLLNNYYDSDKTTTQGQSRFQVVKVPQYTSLSLGGTIRALAWQGIPDSSTNFVGGILALDVQNTLNLAGQHHHRGRPGLSRRLRPPAGRRHRRQQHRLPQQRQLRRLERRRHRRHTALPLQRDGHAGRRRHPRLSQRGQQSRRPRQCRRRRQ